MNQNELPGKHEALRQRTEHRSCACPEECQRKDDRLSGFADPRWDGALVRWCPLCKQFVITGFG
jgi:hypothetical protein